MSRVTGGPSAHARHRRIVKAAKGYRGRRKNTFSAANQAVVRASQNAYKDRKRKKRVFRALWIQRINAAARSHGLTYGRLIDGLKKAEIDIDRKVLADLAVQDPSVFETLVGKARDALGAQAAAG